MSFNFVVSAPVDLSQNTNLFVSNLGVDASAHYVVDVIMGTTLNGLFNVRTYQQNAGDENDYDTILTINQTELLAKLNGDFSQTLQDGLLADGAAINNTSEAADQAYYVRLLEVMALQIFGHAKARAAIANDTEFKAKVADIDAHLTNQFDTNETLRNEFFEQYVQLDRVNLNANDVNVAVDFNLFDSQISFIAMLKGQVQDTNTNGNINASWNGITAVAGSLVSNVDGTYNIQVLTKLNGLNAAV